MVTDLSGTITKARTDATVLDDPEDLEDLAIFHWMGHHALAHRSGLSHFVIGSEPLPPRWQARTKSFVSVADATEFLHPLAVGHGDRQALQTLTLLLTRAGTAPQGHAAANDILAAGAAALVARTLWALPIKRMPSKIGKADATVYTTLNGTYGTKINFAFLGEWEGGQYLRGYVPFDKKGVTAGQSGMTIATGFDIGQINEKELQKYGLPANVVKECKPFTSHKFGGMTKVQVAKWVLSTAPVPVVTKAEADQIDLAVHGQKLASAIKSWDGSPRKPGVPTFVGLPVTWQTVLFSRTFHQGEGMPHTSLAKPFYGAATSGKWKDAVTALRNYAVTPEWYKARVRKEADFLETDMPAEIPDPRAKATK
ncbi:MAG TPA: pesticin C-terminus-like muramidase [Aliidongia sp.]|uniref:pesticin C-terminus-like muramidase n=1 Tax=Aliidongia sp. TaxID=1914230 RepID=UPI002DDD1F9A|nr:pesticin C-terminus-like muramidase [Aliidongia sp.]HEV2674468.1 pesticin C-terminus-like muramidase [Aliidongia sp.]